MRLLGRHDKPLAVGLVIGILIIFERPLRFLLEVARDIEARYQVDLVPALTQVRHENGRRSANPRNSAHDATKSPRHSACDSRWVGMAISS